VSLLTGGLEVLGKNPLMTPDALPPKKDAHVNLYRLAISRSTPRHVRARALKRILFGEAVGLVLMIALYVLVAPHIKSTVDLVLLGVGAVIFIAVLALSARR